jgi:hypothetical protein
MVLNSVKIVCRQENTIDKKNRDSEINQFWLKFYSIKFFGKFFFLFPLTNFLEFMTKKGEHFFLNIKNGR